jgi:regulatory protein YycI of two-component signal transduction system YycFG
MSVYKNSLINIQTIKGFEQLQKQLHQLDVYDLNKQHINYFIETIMNYLDDDIDDDMLQEDRYLEGIEDHVYLKKRQEIMDRKVYHLSKCFSEVFEYVRTDEL